MTGNDTFESQVNSDESLAGVYEHEGGLGYFYLYDLARSESQKVIGSICVSVGENWLNVDDLVIRWSYDEHFVGLFINNQLCAAFDAKSQEAFGGESGSSHSIHESIKSAFRMH